jgi:formylmethanofuran dehydrogenase subunit E
MQVMNAVYSESGIMGVASHAMLKTLAEYEILAEQAHGHLCAGQILGLRMALHGVQLLGLSDPYGADRKRLVTYIEIDRCATDAIPIVTGCRLGKRALKFRDFGKVAATFCDLREGRAIRLLAREDAKRRARELYPEIENRNQQQMRAYREMPDAELFDAQWVRVTIGPEDLPGYKAARVQCAQCGEGINFKREVLREGRLLCRACAGERYYEPL